MITTYADARHQAVEALRQGGIANPARLAKLIRDATIFYLLELDL